LLGLITLITCPLAVRNWLPVTFGAGIADWTEGLTTTSVFMAEEVVGFGPSAGRFKIKTLDGFDAKLPDTAGVSFSWVDGGKPGLNSTFEGLETNILEETVIVASVIGMPETVAARFCSTG